MGDAIPFSILAIILMFTIHKEDSLVWHVNRNE